MNKNSLISLNSKQRGNKLAQMMLKEAKRREKQTTKVSEMIKGTIKMCLKKTHNDPIISVFEINPGNFLRRSSLPLEEWTPLGHILL